MSWFKAAELVRDYAKVARDDKAATSPILKLLAEIRASVLEEMARVLEANARDDKTDPRIVVIPPEAKGEP